MTDVDQGDRFGTWTDPTSRLMYHDVMPVMLNGVDTTGKVIDLGGGNGLLRQFVPHAITVDTDASKHPDVVADALTYRYPTGHTDLVVMRYLLHYLNDAQVSDLFHHVATWHPGRVLVIQFVNSLLDLHEKRVSSVNESKWFRTEQHLTRLLAPWRVTERKAVQYRVGAEFYLNRLGNPNGVAHNESILGLTLEVPR